MRAFFCGVVAALALLTLPIAGCSRNNAESRKRDADQDFAAGLYDRAEIGYLSVIKSDPNDAHALGRLGQIYFEQGRMRHAGPLLARSLSLAPDEAAVRLKLGMLRLGIGQREEARKVAIELLDRNSSDAEALALLAEASTEPAEMDEVSRRLDAVSASGAQTAHQHFVRGLIAQRRGLADEAMAALIRAVELDPKLSPAHHALGVIYVLKHDSAKADEAFRTAAETAPLRSPARLNYAQFKFQQGDIAEARRLLVQMTEDTPDFLPAWRLLAELALQEKKPEDASPFVERLLVRDGNDPDGLLLRSRLHLARGEPARAIADLEKLQGIYPDAPQVMYQLGQAHLASGDARQAITHLTRATQKAPNNAEAVLLLASLNLRRGETTSAVVDLNRLLEKQRGNVAARFLLAEAYQRRGSFDDASTVLQKLATDLPSDPRPHLAVGMLARNRRQNNEARRAFERAVELSATFLPAIEQLVDLDLTEGKNDAALQRAQQLLAAVTDRPEPHILQARVLLALKDAKGAETALQQALQIAPENRTAYFLLARLYADAGSRQQAMENLHAIISRNPKDVPALMLLALVHEQARDFAGAADAYERLVAVNPNFTPALNNLAYLYTVHRPNLDRAEELARKARQVTPYDPYTADTLGWILYNRRQFDAALSLFQESAEKLTDMAEVHFHLGMAHYQLADEPSAATSLRRALELSSEFPDAGIAQRSLGYLERSIDRTTRDDWERALGEAPDDPVALVRLAEISLRDNDAPRAAVAYERLLKLNPKHVPALVGLARIRHSEGNIAQALPLARTARELASNDPVIDHLLGRIALDNNDYKWAASLLQEAVRRLADDPEVQVDYALALFATGHLADAESAMRRAQSLSQSFQRSGAARQFLQFAALWHDPAVAAGQSTLIAEVLRDQPDYGPALFAAGLACEHEATWPEARQRYEQLIKQYPDLTAAVRRLAIVLGRLRASDTAAFDLAQSARIAFPGDPEVAAAFGIISFRRGDFTRALPLLKEAAAVTNSDPLVHFHLGLTYFRMTQPAECRPALLRALELGLPPEFASEANAVLNKL